MNVGSHTIAAAYAGNADFVASLSGSIQQVIDPASTTPVLTATSVRNKHGQITQVILTTVVSAVTAGGGTATGTVTYSVGKRSLATLPLSNGTASSRSSRTRR